MQSVEPRFRDVLAPVLARAARRPARPVLLAALVTALVVAVRASRHPQYTASVTFRMSEGELQTGASSPKPPSHIREYVWDVALSRERILALMEKHGLSQRLRARDPVAAADSLREDIDVEVVRNYFLLDRESAGEPRSAQVVLSFTGGDRRQVEAVVHDIGAALLAAQSGARADRLRRAGELSATELQRAREQLKSLDEERVRYLLRAGGRDRGERARAQAEAAALQVEIESVAVRIAQLEQRAAELELARHAEQQRLGLRFEFVDESTKAARERLGSLAMAAYAAATFLFVLPLAAVWCGAFDSRIYRRSDLTSFGIPVLGVLPDRAGAHDAR